MNEEKIIKLVNELNLNEVIRDDLSQKEFITRDDVLQVIQQVRLEEVLKKNILEGNPDVDPIQLNATLTEEGLVDAVLSFIGVDIMEVKDAFENLSYEEMVALQGAGDLDGEGFIATVLISNKFCAGAASAAVGAVVKLFT
ncbi:mersacidin family lantibiotic [Enterococcus sp.]|uniref:mersacidin family lantibiotic n=1 Tax=Enterococcus sp. TaxID=35783 RepID=UPI0028B1CC43|nr:mersacidin family lantibiotic [Enterococcus sp.]